MCHESEEMVNAQGQTEEEVWDLKLQNPGYIHDEQYESETYHFIIAGVHVRNISAMHPVQMRSYIEKMDMMVVDHDFRESDHDLIMHGYKCPYGDHDLFDNKWIHSYKDMMRGIDEDTGKVHYSWNLELIRGMFRNEMNDTEHTDL